MEAAGIQIVINTKSVLGLINEIDIGAGISTGCAFLSRVSPTNTSLYLFGIALFPLTYFLVYLLWVGYVSGMVVFCLFGLMILLPCTWHWVSLFFSQIIISSLEHIDMLFFLRAPCFCTFFSVFRLISIVVVDLITSVGNPGQNRYMV